MRHYQTYRVDAWGKGNQTEITAYFEHENEAVSFGKLLQQSGMAAFLLRYVLDGKYEVVKAF